MAYGDTLRGFLGKGFDSFSDMAQRTAGSGMDYLRSRADKIGDTLKGFGSSGGAAAAAETPLPDISGATEPAAAPKPAAPAAPVEPAAAPAASEGSGPPRGPAASTTTRPVPPPTAGEARAARLNLQFGTTEPVGPVPLGGGAGGGPGTVVGPYTGGPAQAPTKLDYLKTGGKMVGKALRVAPVLGYGAAAGGDLASAAEKFAGTQEGGVFGGLKDVARGTGNLGLAAGSAVPVLRDVIAAGEIGTRLSTGFEKGLVDTPGMAFDAATAPVLANLDAKNRAKYEGTSTSDLRSMAEKDPAAMVAASPRMAYQMSLQQDASPELKAAVDAVVKAGGIPGVNATPETVAGAPMRPMPSNVATSGRIANTSMPEVDSGVGAPGGNVTYSPDAQKALAAANAGAPATGTAAGKGDAFMQTLNMTPAEKAAADAKAASTDTGLKKAPVALGTGVNFDPYSLLSGGIGQLAAQASAINADRFNTKTGLKNRELGIQEEHYRAQDAIARRTAAHAQATLELAQQKDQREEVKESRKRREEQVAKMWQVPEIGKDGKPTNKTVPDTKMGQDFIEHLYATPRFQLKTEAGKHALLDSLLANDSDRILMKEKAAFEVKQARNASAERTILPWGAEVSPGPAPVRQERNIRMSDIYGGKIPIWTGVKTKLREFIPKIEDKVIEDDLGGVTSKVEAVGGNAARREAIRREIEEAPLRDAQREIERRTKLRQ